MGHYCRLAALLLLLLGLTAVPARAQPAVASLLITELHYDSHGRDDEEEWFELANLGQTAVDLSDYKIGDEESPGGGEGMLQFPAGAIIAPGQVIVVAQTAVAFQARYGFNPDYEINESDAAVPTLRPFPEWGRGRLALANDGDELLLLGPDDQVVDAVSYGRGATHFAGVIFDPTVPGVPKGWSIERIPAHCDTDSAADWLAQPEPTPGVISRVGDCRPLVGAVLPPATADQLPPIGLIQGRGDISPFINQVVTFRGVVTGFYASRNQQGITYYTTFVQDPPGQQDGDPATSDGIALFHGRHRPDLVIGDLIRVTGRVTEFYGLTEMADDGLEWVIESRNHPLPEPVVLDPPAPNDALPAYYEPLEGMLVTVPGTAVVIGPTYSSCGFAVARPESGVSRIVRHHEDDPVGLAILILHHNNMDCAGFPDVAVGDQVAGLTGPLIYHFDQYKLVHQAPAALRVTAVPRSPLPPPPSAAPGQIVVASFNVENLFDTIDDTGLDAEPKPTAAELAVQQTKLAYAIGQVMGCPQLIGIQEVEKESLLLELADKAAAYCGFTYQVTHRESPDLRGIDVALLSDPRRVEVMAVQLRQVCTRLATGIRDRAIQCPAGQEPLSSRPPLQVDALVDGRPLTLFVNHFKSKRGGEDDSAPQRLAQAELINGLVKEMLLADEHAAVIVMGDFNDYYDSPALRLMTTQGRLTNVLGQLPPEQRYSFSFGGASQLIDGLLLSPALRDRVTAVTIIHNSSDYPASLKNDISPANIAYRASDHDIPLLLLQWDDHPPPGPREPAPAGSDGRLWLLLAGLLVSGAAVVAWRWTRSGAAGRG